MTSISSSNCYKRYLKFSFPLSLLIWKLAPALVTGNCVVVKPSPLAPLSALKFVELAQQVFPPGVLSVLSGDEKL